MPASAAPAGVAARLLQTLRASYATPSRRFLNRRVAVTGGASGIGEAVARRCAAEGARVAVFDVLHEQGAAVSREICADGPGAAIFVPCDVSGEQEVAGAFARASADLGDDFDVLICLAANFIYREVHEATHADWARALSVNVVGTASCVKAVVPGMRRKGKGAIVLTSSITGTLAFPAFVPYSATKAAIIQMTRDIALDNGRHGLRVNCIAPGPIFTLGGTVAHAKMTGQDLSALCGDLAADVALKRMGEVAEVASAYAFLGSDDSSYVTGTTLQVDGGFFRK